MIEISDDGFREIAWAYDRIKNHAEDLRPLGPVLRRRWTESEQRLFVRRPWTPKSTSTRRRYRYTVRHMADDRPHRGSPSGPTMRFTGLLERILTTENSTVALLGGERGISLGRKGGLDVTVGITGRSPVAYGAITNNARRGDRPRRQIVVFDDAAHRDAAGDALEYLLGEVRSLGST